jgi:hypothetical protein
MSEGYFTEKEEKKKLLPYDRRANTAMVLSTSKMLLLGRRMVTKELAIRAKETLHK